MYSDVVGWLVLREHLAIYTVMYIKAARPVTPSILAVIPRPYTYWTVMAWLR